MPSAPANVTLTDAQIAQVAYAAGFRGDALVKAVAIGIAESGGRAGVVNFLGCTGIWQIYQSVHVRNNPTWTTAWLKVPGNNAIAAFKLSNGGRNWIPWEAYTNGAYRKYLARATAAANLATSTAPAPPVGGGTTPPLIGGPVDPPSANPIDTSVENTKFAPLFDKETWLRILLIILGIILVLNAVVRMSDAPDIVKTAAKVGADFLPVGKVGKIAKAVTK